MAAIYLTSLEGESGKTLLAAALALRIKAAGQSAGYLKHVASGAAPNDADARFLHSLLDLPTPVERLTASSQGLPTVYQEAAQRADVVLVEGLSGIAERETGHQVQEAARELGGSIVAIVWYHEGLSANEVATAATGLGERLFGVVLNAVPSLRLHEVKTTLVPAIEAHGVPVLSVLTQDRLLMAPTVRELATFLEGEIVAFPENADEPVESIMIGALALDGGLYYYGQRQRKVALTRWDRPDLQMPALATGCQGLICTGGQGPIPYVWNRVQELRVPVVIVSGGTVATASRLNDGFLATRGRPYHPRKAETLSAQLEELVNRLGTFQGTPAR